MRCQSLHAAALGERALPDRPTLCVAFADMKRHDSCGCHYYPSSQENSGLQNQTAVGIFQFCHLLSISDYIRN